jgi:hypothetical protein
MRDGAALLPPPCGVEVAPSLPSLRAQRSNPEASRAAPGLLRLWLAVTILKQRAMMVEAALTAWRGGAAGQGPFLWQVANGPGRN